MDYRSRESSCVMTTLPTCRVVLATFIAPANHCWGMEFALSCFHDNLLAEVVRVVDSTKLSTDLGQAGVRPSQVALGLIPIPTGVDGVDFEYGDGTKSLFPWWARSYVLPQEDHTVQAMLELWERHESELGKYFAIEYSDERVRVHGVGNCFLPWEQADTLDRLFCSKTGPLGVNPSKLLSELRKYQDIAQAVELERLVTPEFLLQECVRWDQSLLRSENELQVAAMNALDEEVPHANVDDITNMRTQIARLRIRIATNLAWPLGVRHLARMLAPIAREVKSSSILCEETQAYISGALSKYPVLAA